jgi:hypothetical protein
MNAFTDTPHALHAPSSMRRPARSRRERCVALVDARYLAWLADQDDAARPRLDRLQACLEAALDAQAFPAEISRLYWYASERPERVLPGIVHRWVAPETSDAGASLTLAMARDLMALAEHPGYDRVVLLTDDDRLLPVVDAVQLQGVTVCLVGDETAEDLDALAKSDAAWSALLRQADERCIVRGRDLARAVWGDGVVTIERSGPAAGRDGRELRDLREGRESRESREGRESRDWGARPGHGDPRAGRLRPMGPSQEELQEMRQALQPMISTWWDDLPVEDRQELEDELPTSRGLPQEADRHLLLSLSQQLGRPLTPNEKKVMRELARDTALGPQGVPVANAAHAAAHAEAQAPHAMGATPDAGTVPGADAEEEAAKNAA